MWEKVWLSTFTLFVLKIAIDTLFLKIFVVVFRGVFVLFIAIALEILSLPIECGEGVKLRFWQIWTDILGDFPYFV